MAMAIPLFFVCACLADDENVTITTFFPAPIVAYRSIRLMPKLDPPETCTAAFRGTLYYSNNTSNGQPATVEVCNGTDWIDAAHSGGVDVWDYNNSRNAIFPVNNSWSVVIGQRHAEIWNVTSGLLEPPGGQIFEVNGSISRLGASLLGTNTSSQTNLGTFNSVTNNTGSTIAGGAANEAQGNWSTVAGGVNNHALSAGATVAGGQHNYAKSLYTFVAGGGDNNVTGQYSLVLGGTSNVINNPSQGYDVILGGQENQIDDPSDGCSMVTGWRNHIGYACHSTVLGGNSNYQDGLDSVIAGAGCASTPLPFAYEFTGGVGSVNQGRTTFVFGNQAKAMYNGTFVFADSSGGMTALADYTFNIRAANGFHFTGSNTGPFLTYHDVAEFMSAPARSPVQAGDLVSVNNKAMVDRSSGAGDRGLIGVVSGKKTCSFFMGDPGSTKAVRRVPVSLAGPVYARVCNESGPLALGDPITSSNRPGVGKKAVEPCRIIGFAMQEEAFKDSVVKDVLVFVSAGYYCSPKELDDMNAELVSLEKEVSALEKK